MASERPPRACGDADADAPVVFPMGTPLPSPPPWTTSSGAYPNLTISTSFKILDPSWNKYSSDSFVAYCVSRSPLNWDRVRLSIMEVKSQSRGTEDGGMDVILPTSLMSLD